MDKRDETMGQWNTIGGNGGAPWQASPGETFGDLPTLREEGVVLAGRYKVVKRLGEGGMGSVWLAEDDKLDNRKVAVKMLPAILAGKKGAYKQVKAEAMMAMKLSHPNIATVRSFEEDEGGNPFLVMDYVEGEPLDDILAEKGPLGEEETVKLLGPVAAALDYAHSQGVVHRDVKPGNVMVRKDGVPFVLDFGIAREVQETMTMVTGKLSSGTLLYMSPEQLHGKAPKAAQDVYSFAAMVYECLAGRPPFSRGQIEWQIDHDAPEELPGSVGEGLRNGVMAGLAKEAGERPGTCEKVLGGGGSKAGASRPGNQKRAMPDGTVVRLESLSHKSSSHHGKKKKVGLGWGWVVAALVAAGMGVGVWQWLGGNEGASPAPRQEEARKNAESSEAEMAEQEAEAEREAKQREEEEAARQEAERMKAERENQERQERDALEAVVYQLGASAKTKAEKAERMDYNRGQGFGQWLDAMNEKLVQGEMALQTENFAKAKEFFEASLAAAAWLEENGPLREDARRAGEAVMMVKKKADEMDALHLASQNYRHAAVKVVSGKNAFTNGDFRAATAAWTEAGKAYGTAEQDARTEKVKQCLKEARAAKLCGDWRKVSDAAQGALDISSSNTEAEKLRREAEENLNRCIYLTAVIEGEEVAATVVEGAPGPDVTTPLSIPLSKGGEYSFTVEYNTTGGRYVGRKTVHAKENGRTEATVVLHFEPNPGTKRTIMLSDNVPMEMVWCPSGSFMMGEPGKQHKVTLTSGFWMAKYEVTQKQWIAVMGRFKNPSQFTIHGGNLPVEKVNWQNCVDFCSKAGHGLQLPTEAQWEYACRAGSTGDYGGSGNLDDMGWYRKDGKKWRIGPQNFDMTHPPGEKQENAWGLYDMHGNVWEWCADWWGDYPDGAVTDPKGPSTGTERIWRGGSYFSNVKECSSYFRFSYKPDFVNESLGFRPVILPDQR